MSAKSIPNLLRGLRTAGLVSWARRTRWALTLVTGLTALALITQGEYSRVDGNPAPAEGLEMAAEPASKAAAGARPEDRRYHAIAEFLSKRYRVSHDVTLDLVGIAHAAGHQIGLDPLLIIAVMAVESRFNPIAESVAGAKGLMQVIPKYHGDKLKGFGGERAVFDPETNILVGAQILKEYLGRTGNLGMALQMYAGALDDEHDAYTTKVMSEKLRLQQVVNRAQSASPARTASARSVVLQPSPLAQ
ncbi:MAG: transglycosylase SLT domain-containing protein [Betaproteobacteria bacterium]|nr:transglycosylase SLT domain-containing protein [Betaproteobacteria bacterium]